MCRRRRHRLSSSCKKFRKSYGFGEYAYSQPIGACGCRRRRSPPTPPSAASASASPSRTRLLASCTHAPATAPTPPRCTAPPPARPSRSACRRPRSAAATWWAPGTAGSSSPPTRRPTCRRSTRSPARRWRTSRPSRGSTTSRPPPTTRGDPYTTCTTMNWAPKLRARTPSESSACSSTTRCTSPAPAALGALLRPPRRRPVDADLDQRGRVIEWRIHLRSIQPKRWHVVCFRSVYFAELVRSESSERWAQQLNTRRVALFSPLNKDVVSLARLTRCLTVRVLDVGIFITETLAATNLARANYC
ncbi:hypothetical protein BS78_04G102200 [Paspalum vaginatum]|nr:hypothetical protein BS78_04G102200 [Paspalum vaginatum]